VAEGGDDAANSATHVGGAGGRLAHVELWSVLLLVLPIFAIVRRDAWLALSEHLLMLSATIIFSSLLIDGGIGETGAYWVFMFPFAAFYITGIRGGWCWNAVFILIMLAAMVLNTTGVIVLPYAEAEMRIFPSTFLFYTLIAYVFNLVIARYEGMLMHRVDERGHEVEAERNRLAAVIDHANEAVLLLDAEGRILRTNPAADMLFGYRDEQWRELTVHALVPEDVRALHGRWFSEEMSDGRYGIMGRMREIRAVRGDGAGFPCELTVSAFDVRGERQLSVILRDLTELRLHEWSRETVLAMRGISQKALPVGERLEQLLSCMFGRSWDFLAGRGAVFWLMTMP